MRFETWLDTDIKKPVIVQRLTGNLFSGDNEGNVVGVNVTENGQPVALSGYCYGYFIRDDGFTVVIAGSITGNSAYVILPASCYTVVGQFSLVIKVGTVAIGAVTGTVYRTTTDAVIDPGEVVPSIEELLDRLATLDNYTDLAEAWAVGERGGVPVSSTDVTYENNSRFYASEAERIFENARVINYAVCNTAANVGEKAVSVMNWKAEPGMWAVIRFTYSNTATTVSLNINNTGAKQIYYNGRSVDRYYLNNHNTYLFIYDGSVFQVVGMHEMGRDANTTIGSNSATFGFGLTASGAFSLAAGTNNTASGNKSFVTGDHNSASAQNSSAEGTYNVASNYQAHAQGSHTTASGENSTSEGLGTIAAGLNEHASGQYNKPDTDCVETFVPGKQYHVGDRVSYSPQSGKTFVYECFRDTSAEYLDALSWEISGKFLDVVGNGTGNNARSNARALDWDGNEYLKGDVYVACNNDSSGGSKLVSEAALTEKSGAASGLATLDSSGKVPASQLPSFVDDVLEYANLAAFPATGESGKIYLDQDTRKVYRWASNQYVVISDYVHPTYTARTGKPTGNQTPGFGGTFQVSQVTSDTSGHITGMTDRTVTIPSSVATTSAAGLMSAADKTKLDGISAGAAAIDDTAGDGDTDVTWSADKLIEENFCIVTPVISSLPLTITDARITHECTLEDFVPEENTDLGWVTIDGGKLILYGRLETGQTLPAQKLRVHRVHGLPADVRTVTLRQQNRTSEGGNYLVAEADNLVPGVQYTWRLYSVANGVDTYLYGIGATTSYPKYSMWFQQVPRSLVDGTVYKVTVSPTTDSSDATASNTVTFVAATIAQS